MEKVNQTKNNSTDRFPCFCICNAFCIQFNSFKGITRVSVKFCILNFFRSQTKEKLLEQSEQS